MSAAAALAWHEANQRHLMAAVAVVREQLERHARGSKTPGAADAARESAGSCLTPPAALDLACRSFGLSPFERDILLLCAGVELDAGFAALCAAARGDRGPSLPTFSLALAALPDAHWSALLPGAPLRRWRLLEVGEGASLTTSPLRIDERILHYLAGVASPDARLDGLATAVSPAGELPPSQAAAARRLRELWAQHAAARPVVQLCGDDVSGKRAVGAAACESAGWQLYALRAGDLPAAPAERHALALLLGRETLLTGAAWLLEDAEGEPADRAPRVAGFVEAVEAPLAVSVREPIAAGERATLRLDVDRPGAAEQRDLWRRALGNGAERWNGQIEGVAAQFRLGLRELRAATATVSEAGATGATALWDACRAAARPRMDDLAQRIVAAAGWEDLVLPQAPKATLHEIAAQVRQRTRVYDTWGFAAKGTRGLGISALFSGPSGSGKTMAAEVLAGDLALDLYRIDLSQVVSKYIGETEKNLRRVFDAAEAGGAILLFDEADALFGKRSEVHDSHDRYANIEVSYLLQRMEAYRGLAILTTNLKSALDSAFLRRIRFIVGFPFPDAALRADIWRRIFPAGVPTDGLDVERLAKLNVVGGSIRNIALNAAFLAADAAAPVRMAHLAQAARSEYAKLEKPLTEAEIGGWR